MDNKLITSTWRSWSVSLRYGFLVRVALTILFSGGIFGVILAIMAGAFESPLFLALGMIVGLIGILFSAVVLLWGGWVSKFPRNDVNYWIEEVGKNATESRKKNIAESAWLR